MNLHRASKQPQWASVPIKDRNSWQAMADKTQGWVTPGNVITVLGFAIATAGLVAVTKDHYWLGLIGLAVGRLFDIADGIAAEKTGTKSAIGESLDAGFDKLITIGTLIVLGIVGLASWWILIALLLPHVVISVYGARGLVTGKRVHPSRFGKLSMATAWVALNGYVLAAALDSNLLRIISYIVSIVSVTLGVLALSGYAKKS